MVGIHGMGGIGKTTLAKAVFNKIYLDFEGSVFLSDVKDAAKEHNGLALLQKQIISEILRDRETNVPSESEGKILIQRRLCFKKVLIIVDDVDEKKQLDALVGSKEWFHKSSRIIITTRNKDILTKHDLNENKIYGVSELDHCQSHQLFCYHAFRTEKPREGYADLTDNVVRHAGKLPLALQTLGIYLYRRDKGEWEETLKELEKCPPDDVIRRLRITYDGLTNKEQHVFLDIACFFNRMELQYAQYIWEACGFPAKTAVRNLVDKALVKTNKRGELEMHDLLQDMGKQIVKKESPDEPWKRTRLWNYHNVSAVMERLKEHPKKYKKVEGISVDFSQRSQETACLNGKALALLPSLRLLRINNTNFHNDLNGDLRIQLKWLEWKGCPLERLPDCLDLKSTAVLDLSNSKIVKLWNEQTFPTTNSINMAFLSPEKSFEVLKVLNLKGCKFLRRAPNFERAPNLVKLILDDCCELVEIDKSIWTLKKLEFCSIRRCEKLKGLPDANDLLHSLQGCSQFLTSSKLLEQTKSLKELDFRGTGIERLPSTIGTLTNLQKLLLRNCSSLVALPDTIGCMANLQKIDVRNCRLLAPLPSPAGFTENFTSLCLLHDFMTQEYHITFDVFISSSLEETAKDLANALWHALKNRGIRVYLHQEINNKHSIEELSDAIERSEIFVPIIIEGYAKSRRCLFEITRMVECKRKIVPIFLDTDQLDITILRGAFMEAFRNHEENKELDVLMVDEWRMALKEAGGLEGYCFKSQPKWDTEEEQIQSMAERLLSMVNKNEIDDEPIDKTGMDYHVQNLLKMLDIDQTSDVRMIGIVGTGGVAKKPLAEAVYRRIRGQFEGGSSFVSGVNGRWCTRPEGFVSLQRSILDDIATEAKISIKNAQHGRELLESFVGRRRILLVLTDIGHVDELKELVGSLDRFAPGSRIIVTARDKALLHYWGVKWEWMYDANKLSGPEQSFRSFSRCAFVSDEPKPEYLHLSREIVHTINERRVVIQVVGSYLSRVSAMEEWRETLQKLKGCERYDTVGQLKVIYDRLEKNEKEMVLDVACFLAGKETEDAIHMWRDCGYLPDDYGRTNGRQILFRNPFFKINGRTNHFEMQASLQSVGRHIAETEGEDPSSPSRLDYFCFNYYKEPSNVQGVVLEGKLLCCSVKAEKFKRMSRLRLLWIKEASLEGDFREMPKEIKWLEWKGCPLESLPSDFSLQELLILDLSHSTNLTRLCCENKIFLKLKSLYLNGCVNLVVCPDFASIPCLQKLVLDNCEQLQAVDESIGELASLLHLSMNHCKSLRSLPEEICRLRSLRTLKLKGCSGICSLPAQMWEMKAMEELDISFTAIERVPYSLGCLPKLKKVNVTGCTSLLASLSSLD